VRARPHRGAKPHADLSLGGRACRQAAELLQGDPDVLVAGRSAAQGETVRPGKARRLSEARLIVSQRPAVRAGSGASTCTPTSAAGLWRRAIGGRRCTLLHSDRRNIPARPPLRAAARVHSVSGTSLQSARSAQPSALVDWRPRLHARECLTRAAGACRPTLEFRTKPTIRMRGMVEIEFAT
jgi:hypothetical protein